MRAATLTTVEHDLLDQVRREGVVVLTAETRSFAEAKSLEQSGLLRAVRRGQDASTRFVLSGAGISLVGAPPARV
jgi:hypothetical protein